MTIAHLIKRMTVTGICLVLVACGGRQDGRVMVSGQIEGVDVTAGSKVGGRVAEVLVREGNTVRAGQVLVRLDDAEAQALVSAAEAKVAQARATVAKLESGATAEQLRQAAAAAKAAEQQYAMAKEGARSEEKGAAQATAAAARAQYDGALDEFERAEKLYKEGALARRLYDQAQAAMEAAKGQYDAALEKADLVESGARDEEIAVAAANFERAQAAYEELKVGPRAEDIAVARAAVQAAEADLERARVTLKEMTITSPMDGLIEALDVHPGDLVKPGPVVKIVDPDQLELAVYVSAMLLGYIGVGQEVAFVTDAHGDTPFSGVIEHIAAEGEFTPRNLQTFEERVQQVFGVTLAFDSAGGKLRPGMTATAVFPAPEGLVDD